MRPRISYRANRRNDAHMLARRYRGAGFAAIWAEYNRGRRQTPEPEYRPVQAKERKPRAKTLQREKVGAQTVNRSAALMAAILLADGLFNRLPFLKARTVGKSTDIAHITTTAR